jgi:hypothetical protein
MAHLRSVNIVSGNHHLEDKVNLKIYRINYIYKRTAFH